jgi:hypothetical protein
VGIHFTPWRAISSGPRCHQEPIIEYGSIEQGRDARIKRMSDGR